MPNLTEASLHYEEALKAGRRYVRECVSHGKNAYPEVLDEIISKSGAPERVNIGLVDIPSELIVGTCFAGRISSFSGNFMPLMDEKTEFAAKWISLCAAHLGEVGIRDPITCFEYMGKFYVQEGNKRVSVLKSYGAPVIPGRVTRIMPPYADDEKTAAYYAFTGFFRCSGMYSIQFPKAEMYGRFLEYAGIEPGRVWTEDEKMLVRSAYYEFKSAYLAAYGRYAEQFTPAEALMVYLQFHPFRELTGKTEAQITEELRLLEPQLLFVANDSPAEVHTEPVKPENGIVRNLISAILPPRLNIAFIHSMAPDTNRSEWAKGHDLGRLYLEERMGNRVSVRSYACDADTPDEVMERAAADGAQLLIVTAPTLTDAVIRTANAHPDLKVLICALTLPYARVRTYYSRSYEAQFIAGAMAGAVTENGKVGYIARSPIMGVIADINAFALGVRMTNPDARVKLEWSSLPGDPEDALRGAGCDVLANRTGEGIADWAVYKIEPDGTEKLLSFILWNWGSLYEKMVDGILNGAWNDTAGIAPASAVNYWWGMDSGVIDIIFTGEVPDGVRQLVRILRSGLRHGRLSPFAARFSDNEDHLRCDGRNNLTPDDIMHMNYLAENVDGRIPEYDELLPMARALSALMEVQREDAK